MTKDKTPKTQNNLIAEAYGRAKMTAPKSQQVSKPKINKKPTIGSGKDQKNN